MPILPVKQSRRRGQKTTVALIRPGSCPLLLLHGRNLVQRNIVNLSNSLRVCSAIGRFIYFYSRSEPQGTIGQNSIPIQSPLNRIIISRSAGKIFSSATSPIRGRKRNTRFLWIFFSTFKISSIIIKLIINRLAIRNKPKRLIIFVGIF